jgi:hypothetical protein
MWNGVHILDQVFFKKRCVQVQPTHLFHTTLCRVGENEERILVTQKRENSSNTSFLITFGEFAVDTAHLAHGVAKGVERLLAHLYFPVSVEEMRAKLITLGLLKILPRSYIGRECIRNLGGGR